MNKYELAYIELLEKDIAFHLDEQGLVILPGKTFKKGVAILEKYGV